MTVSLGSYFLIRMLINMTAIVVLIRFVYFRVSRHRAYASSFILFGLGVFLVTSQLSSVDISMGFAFGLFAIFSMLRYRTESITIKEMTYLFLVIAIALLSAVGTMSHVELALLLCVICGMAYITETSLLLPNLEERTVEYEKIENIVPAREAELLQDLRERLGLDVRSVEIESLNFLRDTARLKVQFVPPKAK
ncbi:MAG: DUF4956 domain-containing protein [Halieaceae bacterium]|jgi:hypothetical protein|nr:DUF4956 domain-containing protein [Halieaceae bacterium]